MVKVFISGPYTLGDVNENLSLMVEASNELINNGFNPLPLNLAYHPIETKYPRIRYVDWIDITYDWVEKCDCLLRLPGESRGSDGEVKLAEELGLPVFYTVSSLVEYYDNLSKVK